VCHEGAKKGCRSSSRLLGAEVEGVPEDEALKAFQYPTN